MKKKHLFLTWVLSFLVTLTVVAIIVPVDEDGKTQISDFEAFLIFAIPIIIVVLKNNFSEKMSNSKNQQSSKSNGFGAFILLAILIILGVLFFQSAPVVAGIIIALIVLAFVLVEVNNRQNHKVLKMVERSQFYLDSLPKAHTISEFVDNHNLLMQEYNNLIAAKKGLLSRNVKDGIDSIEPLTQNDEDYQWLLRDTIDRQKNTAIKNIKKTYKNSQAYKLSEYNNFCLDVRTYNSIFNEETRDFANSCIDELSYALGGVSGRRMPAQDDYASYQRSLLTPSLRYDILKRDGFRCTICGRGQEDGVKLHVDHIKPVSKGGETTPSNLRTLCQDCNLGKSDKYDEESEN